MLSKIIPVLLVLTYGIVWIGAAFFFGYPGFITIALISFALTAVSIMVATAG